MGTTLDIIFDAPPIQWGLRGDPYLWNDLKKHFAVKSLPYDKEQFISDFNAYFLEICNSGKTRTRESGETTYVSTFVSKYAPNPNSGISKGVISHEFWRTKGLPLLIERLEYHNTKTRNK